MKTYEDVVVVGGGISGLSAALALALGGRRVHVLEQATGFRDAGAGVHLGPNAFRMLDRLGLGEAVRSQAWRPPRLRVRDAVTGEAIVDVELGAAFEARHGGPYATMHRGDLMALILEACRRQPGITLLPSHRVVDFGEVDGRVFAITEDGARFVAGALVGADGIWSSVRARIVGDGAPQGSGHVACRALLPRDRVPQDLWSDGVEIWAGPGTRITTYPVRGGETLNVVATIPSRRYEPGWDAQGDPHILDGHFDAQQPTVRRLAGLTDSWRLTVNCDREPVAQWSRGRMTLAGDAAHPMLTGVAQNAAMALEDAVCLGDMAGRHPDDLPAALQDYARARYLRAGRVQLVSRHIEGQYFATGVARELRARLIARNLAEGGMPDLGWIYAGPAAWSQDGGWE